MSASVYRDAEAPRLARIRTVRPPTSPRFPLYKDLERLLLDKTIDHQSEGEEQRKIAHAMATLSTYAYSDEVTVSEMAARLGLVNNRVRLIAREVDVLFVRSTAYLIQSDDGRVVVLAYRGTSPTSAISWLGDLNIDPEKVKISFDGGEASDYKLHRGFYRNVRATGWKVVEGLQRALEGRPVTADVVAGDVNVDGALLGVDIPEDIGHPRRLQPMEALYITGHSLGGAMASVAAILLRADPDYDDILGTLRAAYTFGGPMVCEPQLAKLCDREGEIGRKFARYVYGNDAVPQLPPLASGCFKHFGQEFRHKANEDPGGWRLSRDTCQMPTVLSLGWLVPSFLAKQLTPFRRLPFVASLADHLPQYYLNALGPDDGLTEFGD